MQIQITRESNRDTENRMEKKGPATITKDCDGINSIFSSLTRNLGIKL